MKDDVKPIADRVACKRIVNKEELEKDGIYIPETAIDKPQMAEVIAVGPGRRDDDGEIVPMTLKVGDKVLLPKHGITEVKVDGTELAIIKEDDVLLLLVAKKG